MNQGEIIIQLGGPISAGEIVMLLFVMFGCVMVVLNLEL